MNFRHFTGSLLAATTLFVSTLPAQAGPFDGNAGGIFKPVEATITPGVIGNINSKQPAANSAQPANGNGEVQGLGNHQSWVDTGVLAKDPRALCSDVGLGSNTRSSSSKIALSNAENSSSSSAKTHSAGGGGGVSVLGIVGVNGNGASQGSDRKTESTSSRSTRNQQVASNSSTVVQGRNCDAFVESAAARDMNYQDNVTRRYEIKTNRRGQQVNQMLDDK